MAIGPTGAAVSQLQQVYRLPDDVANGLRNAVENQINRLSINETETDARRSDRRQNNGVLLSQSVPADLPTPSNSNTPSATTSNSLRTANAGTQDGVLLRNLIDTQEKFISGFDDLSDIPRQLGALFQNSEDVRSFVLNLSTDNEVSVENNSELSPEEISALQELFNEIPEDQIEKFINGLSDFKFSFGEENQSETEQSGAEQSSDNQNFEQLQQQFDVFQNLNTTDTETELARV